MRMPSKIATLLLIVYFLLVGLAGVGVWTAPPMLTGIVALAVAIFLFLDR